MNDVRIRTSNRPTKVPASYKAYIFQFASVDADIFKVVIASDLPHAHQFVCDWCREQGIQNSFFRFRGEDDFAVVANDVDYCEILL